MKLLTAFIALAAYVASPGWLPSNAAAETPAAKQTVEKKKMAAKPKPKAQRASPYSSNPEYDVYVNGNYVGSDPDPFIRWSLRREWLEEQLESGF